MDHDRQESSDTSQYSTQQSHAALSKSLVYPDWIEQDRNGMNLEGMNREPLIDEKSVSRFSVMWPKRAKPSFSGH